MNVLVINCGSSSLKYQLINSDTEKVLAKGNCERIGIDGKFTYKAGGKTIIDAADVAMPTHAEAISAVLKALVDKEHGVIDSMSEIDAVGHRVVHGGERFGESVVLTDEIIKDIEECSYLAPLHNPSNLTGIYACRDIMPNAPMVAVFDTAFHQTIPREAFLYGIPAELYEKDGLRRYGFHGTSHSYVSKKAAEVLRRDIKDIKIIVCHLGNGASVCAVKNGKSVDTSMGLTPLAGLVMGTRSGDVDPSIFEFMERKGYSIEQTSQLLNRESGVLGLSGGLSSDFRDLQKAAEEGNTAAKDAIDVFCYQVIKYIGAYAAAMDGVDVICFTAGVGENSPIVRKKIMERLGYLGVAVNDAANEKTYGTDTVISTDDSKVTVMVISTNEEIMICRETVGLLGKK